MSSSLKILVCYHKPDKLYASDVFVPIHVGRALGNVSSKNGNMLDSEYHWMLDNMIGDDTGDNISYLNRKFCELTALYWAWKNYDKLGNPDYIGLCHYRRVFNLSNIKIKHDAYIAPTWISDDTICEQYKNFHKTDNLNIAIKILCQLYPEYKEIAQTYCQGHEAHLFNVFIMKKNIFFNYTSWIFDLLSKIEPKISLATDSINSLRELACIAERLQDIYMLKLKQDGLEIRELSLNKRQSVFSRLKTYIDYIRCFCLACLTYGAKKEHYQKKKYKIKLKLKVL